jgi:hypothetical protein
LLRGLVALALALAAGSVAAEPDLSKGRRYGPLHIYPDHRKDGLYYFEPGELSLARDLDGTPELRFLQMRYVGSAVYGNEGEHGSHSTLTLEVEMDGPDPARLAAARRGLAKALGHGVELRPLPIARFETALIYAPVGPGREVTGGAEAIAGGHFEAGGEGGRDAGRGAFWSERTYSVAMDPATSQLFWKALQAGDLVLSVSYAIFTRGVVSDEAGWLREHRLRPEVRNLQLALAGALGPARPAEAEQRKLAEQDLGQAAGAWLGSILSDVVDGEDEGPELPSRIRFLRAGASAIRIDARRHRHLFQRVDFNEKAPPGYAVVKVYCYDFRDGLRPDLFYKKVTIEAQAVGGRAVPVELKFLHGEPDLYARSVRFPVPVRIDQPYRYRVTTASRDGRIETGPWQVRETWGPILDVTTRPAETTQRSGGQP